MTNITTSALQVLVKAQNIKIILFQNKSDLGRFGS